MKFIKSGNMWSLTPNARMDVRDCLPTGNYTICKNPITGDFYLEESEKFTLPKRLYGKTERYGERILKTFESRNPGSQVGVFLSGAKGSGKTLLAKYIANISDLPVVIVNTAYTEDRFMRAIQGIEQDAVIIFDEFEKLYSKDDQEAILTLFDGVYTARNKIMIITCNDRWSVRDFFHNRPSRLRYAIAFDGLEPDFVEEYCDDRLDDKKYLKQIVTLCNTCEEFNFDMLQTLVDELNQYGGDFEETLDILNVKPISMGNTRWRVTLETPKDKKTKWKFKYGEVLNRSPLRLIQTGQYGQGGSIEIGLDGVRKDDEDFDGDVELTIRSEHLYSVDPAGGILVFKIVEDKHEFVVTITEEKPKNGSWGGFFNQGAF
jgi:hypothetical protein